MSIEYGEFETLLAPCDPAKVRQAVYREMLRYQKAHTDPKETPEAVLRSIFVNRIARVTGQRKGAGRGGDEPYLQLLDSWRRGEGSYPLAKAAYYWLHVEPADKSYARQIDERLQLTEVMRNSFPENYTGQPAFSQNRQARIPTLGDVRGASSNNLLDALNRVAQNATVFFPQIAGSGFEFHDLIEAAEEELFICGQNLFGLVRVDDGARTLQLIDAAVKRGVTIKLMICNLDETNHIASWSFAVNSDSYAADLLKATRIMSTWPAQFSSGDLQIRVAKFIPTSITFVDPLNRSTRFAIITPHHFTPVSAARPFVLLTHHADASLFDQYYRNYEYVWDHSVGIDAVQSLSDVGGGSFTEQS